MAEEIFEFEFPEGAFVRRPANAEEGEAVLGAAYETASPGGIFGGADIHSFMGADGWLYVTYCGERPGRKFGTHAFRVFVANTHTEWLELETPTELRSTVSEEPSGLYLTFTNDRGNKVLRQRLPKFVMPGYPSNGKTGATQTPPPPSSGGIDSAARDQIAVLSNRVSKLERDLAAALGRISALERRPAATPQSDALTPGQINSVRDVMWNDRIILDRVYAEVQAPNSGLRNAIIAAAKVGK